MPNESNRNTIMFIVCAVVILIAYQLLVLEPSARRAAAERTRQAAAEKTLEARQPTIAGGAATLTPLKPTREAARAASPRVAIDTPALSGSIALRGARIDDLYLKRYRVGADPKSAPVEVLRPQGAENSWFAEFTWAGSNLPGLPGPATLWTVTQGSVLTPTSPVVLSYDNGAGLVFTRTISIDDQFMFTVADQVRNAGGQAVTLAPYATIERQGLPADLGKNQIVHEGAIGSLASQDKPGGFTDKLAKYNDWKKGGTKTFSNQQGGWVGLTDKYWLAALIPDQALKLEANFRVMQLGGVDVYDANYLGAPRVVAPGATTGLTTRLFVGAKTVPILKEYEKAHNIPRFENAVDWGMFWFFTKPIFLVLDFFFQHVGNFGTAILLLTVTVKLLFFPLANKSYESMSKMKKLSGPMEEMRKKHKDDPAKQQQEIMALYAREKVNPLMGCLPVVIQIPVFYSLYKVLTVTIEMRHAPFFGWVHDLSARDPASIWNLFGLLPFHPGAIPAIGGFLDGPLHLGPWVIAYGFTMWLTTAMNPPAPDPMQQKIFQLMPIMFTFIMAPFAVGLIIYWTWNNVLSILQQYVIMHRLKVENPIDQLVEKLRGKASPAAGRETGRVSEPIGSPALVGNIALMENKAAFSEEALETARVLFARPALFMMGAAKIDGLPPPDLPEVAFAGRSNVGKSSLINGLVGQNHLARASNEPGRTREVNFFVLDERIRLVDLPGYGFARASKGEARRFQNLGRDYLRGRPNLKRVYLLIDARHGLKDVDAEALDALDTVAVSYQIVLTKADKLKPSEGEAVAARTAEAIRKRPAAFPRVALTSSEKGDGLPQLRAEVAAACGVEAL